jgi:uncharacterized membrane protein
VSKERAKAREERVAARAAEVAAAAARREKALRRSVAREKLALPERRRRYGALPGRVLAQLVAVFLAVQVVTTVFVESWRPRISVAVLSAAVLVVYTKTRRSTPR